MGWSTPSAISPSSSRSSVPRQHRPVEKQPIDVDAAELDVVAERLQPELGVGPEIALAELDEAAVGPQQRHALVQRLAGERIQHDVDALAAGQAADLIGKGERARVARCSARRDDAGNRRFVGVPAVAKISGADALRVLDRGQADAAGGAVDQHALAALQPRQVMQRVIGGQHGDRERGRRLEADAGRLGEEAVRGQPQMRAERSRREAEHGIAGFPGGDAGPDREHLAGELHAERSAGIAALECFLGQEPDPLQHVAEIEAAGMDADGHLAGLGARHLDRLQHQPVLAAVLGKLETVSRR